VESKEVLRAWGRALLGYHPALSIEITRECPLSCPGCYAYGADHLGGPTLRDVSDYKGQDLVNGILRLVDFHRPLHVSLVGGEPLVRYRELSVLLPILAERGIAVQVVTSAVRPIPQEWSRIPNLFLTVSIDGLQPEHDARRKPATYERILKHVAGHQIVVHCTVTSQMTRRSGYLREFVAFWSERPEVRKIWMSLFTPQVGERSEEILAPPVRSAVIDELAVLQGEFPKLEMQNFILEGYRKPPRNPRECTFARATYSVTADLKRKIEPCQFGGNPDCSQCGCMASAGLAAVARERRLGIRLGWIFETSLGIGRFIALFRRRTPAPIRHSGDLVPLQNLPNQGLAPATGLVAEDVF
jgi:MoaA/NifB/PqqE/SkfB family radical SAM enzyme